MKVLQINTVCGIKSTGRICTDIADVLLEEGHDCKIIYGRECVPSKYEKLALKIGNKWDVYAHIIYTRLTGRTGFGSKRATKRIIEKIKEYDPDIIHIHNLHGYYINIEELFRYIKEYNKPVLWTLHDCWAFTGQCTHFEHISCFKWRTGCQHCDQTHIYPKSLFLDNSKSNYESKRELFRSVQKMKLITPSKWLANYVRKSFLNKYDLSVIPNGIDLRLFRPIKSDIKKSYGIENKKVILGVASSWGDRKGLNDFFVLSSMIDQSYKIVMIGLSEEEMKLAPLNILSIKKTNDVSELIKWYSTAYVFVNPSKLETMGMTTVEALACGTPVVVYNNTALPEVVTENCGFVIDSNPKAILEVLDKIDFDENDCILRAKNYDKNLQYIKYIQEYKKMLGD